MIRKMVRFFIDNAKVFNLFAVAMTLAGMYLYVYGKKEGFPSIKLDQIFISTIWPGASAEEVERIISTKIEQEIKGVNGAKKITSRSVESLSTVIFEVDPDQSKNFQKILTDIKNAVDRVRDLPETSEKPLVFEVDFDLFPVISVLAVGPDETQLRETVHKMEDDLRRLPGVGKVDRVGYRDREVWIEVNPDRLRALQLTMSDVISAIRVRNVNLPGGKLEISGKEFLIRTLGQFTELSQVADTVVRANEEGAIVRVKDLANVRWDFKEAVQLTRNQGETAIRLQVLKKKSADIIRVADQVKTTIDKYNGVKRDKHGKEIALAAGSRLAPAEVRFFYSDDTSYFVKRRLAVLQENAFFGLILVVICLILFFDGITTLWATAGVPIVFCTSLVYLNSLGMTLNLMSMFGFIIVVGLLVDDAVVVAENIFRHREMGKEPMAATVDGSAEVFQPVLATTLTTILAFLPLMMLPGIFGQFLGIIPFVVTVCMLLSFLETFAFLPGRLVNSLAALDRGGVNAYSGWRGIFKEGLLTVFFKKLANRYRVFITWLMKRPILNLTLASLFCFALTVVGFIAVKKEFFSGATDEYVVRIDMPVSSPLSQTALAIDDVERRAKAALGVSIREVISTAGYQENPAGPARQRTFVGGVRVILKPDHGLSKSYVIETMEKELRQIPGLASFAVEGRRGGPPVQAPIAIKLFGDDFTELKKFSELVMEDLRTESNTVGVGSSLEPEKDEWVLVVNEAAANAYGVNVQAAALAVRYAFNGGQASIASSMRGEEKDVTILVKYAQAQKKSLDEVANIHVQNRMGQDIPIKSFATLIQGKSITVIDREDDKRVVTVTSELKNPQDRKDNSQAINARMEPRIAKIAEKFPGVRFKLGGEEEDRKELSRAAGLAFLISMFAIYILLLALFRSFVQPVIVMFVIPYSITGVIVGLWVSNVPFGLMPIIGTVALIGIIVKSTIIMVSFINALRARGYDRKQASIEGSVTRLRPILATSITGVVGLIPLAYGLGGSEPFIQPMGLALAWGLAFGTIITLIILPLGYYLFDAAVERVMTRLGFTYKPPFDIEGGSDEASHAGGHGSPAPAKSEG